MLTAVLILGTTATSRTAGADLPDRFVRTVAFSGLDNPVTVRFSPDGRVFVAEKRGVVKVFDSLADTTPDVFVDLRTKVHNFWDRGLLGLALAPAFPTDPSVYVLYTHDAAIGAAAPLWGSADADSDGCPNPPGATKGGCVVSGRLSRFVAVGNSAGPEQVLVEDWCQQFPSHSVGSLVFGPDGALYASAGDGASFNYADYGQAGSPVNPCGDPPGGVGGLPTGANGEGGSLRAQDLLTPGDPVGLDGTIIRIDPFTGDGLPDNPLAASSDLNARRIVAIGVRNPFRLTIRPGTDEVWFGDVGQAAWEEIDRLQVPAGPRVENYGWPCYEGADVRTAWVNLGNGLCATLYAAGPSAVVNAHYRYRHGEPVADESAVPKGSSITGVAFYEGGNYPNEYDDALFFADYTRGRIFVMFAGADGLPDPSTRQALDTAATGVVDLQIGPAGDLFWVDMSNGQILRISYRPENSAPTPHVSASPTEGHAPMEVAFSAAGSTDIDGDAITFEWDLDGDGAFDDSTDVAPVFTYSTDGDVTVSLRVTDDTSLAATATVVVHIGNIAPTPTIVTPSAATTWQVDELLSFSGSADDAEEGALAASDLSWSVVVMHCQTVNSCHPHEMQSWSGVAGGSFVAPDHEYPSHLELRLTATDDEGLRSTVVRRLYPRTVTLRFESSPSGVPVTVGDTTTLTPFERIVIAGSSNSISAAPSSDIGNLTYVFRAWSDLGDIAHVVAPIDGATYRVLLSVHSSDAGTATALADRLRCEIPAQAHVRCALT